jgi:hypothetical protein
MCDILLSSTTVPIPKRTRTKRILQKEASTARQVSTVTEYVVRYRTDIRIKDNGSNYAKI